MINRRKLLKSTAVGGSGIAALAYSPQPTLAAGNWTANSPSQVSNSNGELSSLEITEDAFSFELEYNGLGVRSHSIEFELEARLDGGTYESVFSDAFEVTGDSGTANESKLSTSFPVDLLAETSMTASDFNEPNAGETNVTTVDLRVSFSWSDGEYSASDSATSPFNVSVANTGPVIIDNFEDGDMSEYTEYADYYGNYEVNGSTTYNGSYSLQMSGDSWDAITLESTSGLPSYPKPGDTIIAYFRMFSYEGGWHSLRFGGSNRNNCYSALLTIQTTR